jgi:hypothetical protein
VGAAIGLGVLGLVGSSAYESSTATAALDAQLEETCATDTGVALGAHDAAELDVYDGLAADIDHVAPALRTGYSVPLAWVPSGAATQPASTMVLVARDGQFSQLGAPVAEPAVGELVVPDWVDADGPLAVGNVVDVRPARDGDPQAEPVSLTVASRYPDIPVRPEPEFWCAWREAIRPTVLGDRLAPVVLVHPGTLELLPEGSTAVSWELWPDREGLRRDQAAGLVDEQRALLERVAELEARPELAAGTLGLETLVRRSGSVADFVALSIAPSRYAAALAALVLLCGAGVLVAREQQHELRLRALRGVGPVGIARDQLHWLVPTTLVGALAGGLLAVAGVWLLGPSPLIEPAALISGSAAGVVGWLIGLVVVALLIGWRGAALVDRRERRRTRVPFVFEGLLVVAAVWSFLRLDRLGGVRQVGVEVRGGDLAAQSFPLLGASAVVALMWRPTTWAVRRLRGTGGGLSPGPLLGWRRVTADAAISTTVVLATAASVAFAFQAELLTASVGRLLDDKAELFTGSDLAISVLEEPAALDGLGAAATSVARVEVDDGSMTVLAVDPATFADVAFWRDDAMDVGLDDAMSAITADGSARVRAISVDPSVDEQLGPRTVGIGGRDVEIDVVLDAAFFPGFRHREPLLVIDRSTLEARAPLQVWVKDPQPDVLGALEAQGVRVTSVNAADDVFSVTSFLATQWAYTSLAILGALIGLVTLLAQLLVLDARQGSRRVAHVLARPMGLRRRDETVAIAVEIGLPLLVGVAFGGVIGWLGARLAIERLDSLRDLEPPGVLVSDVDTLLIAVAVSLVAVVVGALIGRISLARTRPMEVMRGAAD